MRSVRAHPGRVLTLPASSRPRRPGASATRRSGPTTPGIPASWPARRSSGCSRPRPRSTSASTGVEPDDRRAEGAGRLALAEHALLARRGRGRGPLGPGLHQGRRPADARVLDRPVRPRLRPVRHDPLAVDRRDGGAARPRPRPGRRRRRAQLLRGLPDRRRLRRRQVGAARPRPLDRRLRPRRARALLSIAEVRDDLEAADRPQATSPSGSTAGSSAGCDPGDGQVVRRVRRRPSTCAGYAGPPPMVHLRRGETLRRYLEPGLDDGKTFVFWGRNYNTGGIPGPERSQTWVEPAGADVRLATGRRLPARPGPLRQRRLHLPARLRHRRLPGGRRSTRTTDHVTFEFYTPYIIAATPAERPSRGASTSRAAATAWSLRGKADCPVSRLHRPGRDLAGLRPVRRRPRPDRPRQGAPPVLPAARRRGRGSSPGPG